jgi:hypothetical protein
LGTLKGRGCLLGISAYETLPKKKLKLCWIHW